MTIQATHYCYGRCTLSISLSFSVIIHIHRQDSLIYKMSLNIYLNFLLRLPHKQNQTRKIINNNVSLHRSSVIFHSIFGVILKLNKPDKIRDLLSALSV